MAINNEKWKSIRVKLFFILCIVIVLTILLLIIINNIVLERFYIYSKLNTVKDIYQQVNKFYSKENSIDQDQIFKKNIKQLALKNNLEILMKTDEDILLISTNSEQFENYDIEFEYNKKEDVIYNLDNVVIKEIKEENSNIMYMTLLGRLNNNYELCIRTPISTIKESVKVSNRVLLFIGGISIIISGIGASIISKKFTKPILELNEIAEGMSKLDFNKKYRISDTEDEINNLGKSINSMSDKLENTIKELKKYNCELAKDIEEKSKIDEMRKQFISDVSHELKTPISLIQGYAEGLVEDVNKDSQSREYYAGVILDEANKMDKLVKQLLELMKLEYDVRILNNKEIDIVSLIKEVIRKYSLMIEEKGIKVEFCYDNPINVYVDDFYIEHVVSNYITNAIKYSKEKNGTRLIKINIENINTKVRIRVFNTGDNIIEEDLNKIWGRFYKGDSSRNRDDGGTGIGLAYVKAVMNNYNNEYGVINKENGVEFYFDCELKKS